MPENHADLYTCKMQLDAVIVFLACDRIHNRHFMHSGMLNSMVALLLEHIL